MEPNLAVSIYVGHVDLYKLNMFSVYTQHLSLIVFEIKDEKYYFFLNLMKKGQ
jgi:hypothetical protein